MFLFLTFITACSEGGLIDNQSSKNQSFLDTDFNEDGVRINSSNTSINYCINQENLSGWKRSKVEQLRDYINSNSSIRVESAREYRSYTDHDGSTKRLRYDIIYHPNHSSSTPLVIYFHSGGFKKGDRCNAYYNFYNEIRFLLANKIAFATVSYRFLQPENGQGVLQSLDDGRVSLQRLKIRNSSYNVNRNRVALVGRSAGSGIASWLALSDDMRNLNSRWYTPRQSTRVQCAMLIEAQATYNLYEWLHYFSSPTSYVQSWDSLLNYDDIKEMAANFYGKESYNDLSYSYAQDYASKVDMLDLISSDDPMIYIQNTKEPDSLYSNGRVSISRLLHHRAHVEEFKRVADSRGLSPVWAYKGRNSSASLTKRKSFFRHSNCLNF